jgi:hypothetical protein
MYSLFESVTDIWIIWLATLLLMMAITRHVWGQVNWRAMKRFYAGERGASYALPYVLTFPFFVLLMAVMIQTTLILLCKIGSMYSAHAASRTAIVWISADPTDSERGRDYARYAVKRAATMAMVPFASSNYSQRQQLFPLYPLVAGDGDEVDLGAIDLPITLANLLAYVDRELYLWMYQNRLATANANDSVPAHPVINNPTAAAKDDYVRNKYAYAAAATKITIPEGVPAWNTDVPVKVRYRMAFHIPGTARILGGSYSWITQMYYRDIETTVTLPSEAAESSDGKVGIPYDPSLLRRATE